MKKNSFFFFLVFVFLQLGTTYILKEGGVELATWVEEDGQDETRIIHADENEENNEAETAFEETLQTEPDSLDPFFDEEEFEDLMPPKEMLKEPPKVISKEVKQSSPVLTPKTPRKEIQPPPPRRGFSFKKKSIKTFPKKKMKSPLPAQAHMSSSLERVTPEQLRMRDAERRRETKAQPLEKVNKERETKEKPKRTPPKKTYAFWEWAHNQEGLSKALRIQRRTGEPILIYFENSWSPYGKRFDRDVFSKREVQDYLNTFLRVRIDQDQEKELFKKYRVRSVPAFKIQLSTGKTIPIHEVSSAPLFLSEIKKAIKK